MLNIEHVPCSDHVPDKSEEAKIIPYLNLVLSSKPSNSEVEDESKLELTSSESSKASPPMAMKPLEEMHVERVKRKAYYCKYCNKKFSSSQALGGHQNAHKRARAMEKLENSMAMDRFRYLESGLHPYPAGMAALPLGSSLNRSFGAPLGHEPLYPRHKQSRVDESYFPWSHVGLGHDYQGMSKPRITNYWTRNNGYQMPGRTFIDAGPNSAVSGGLLAMENSEFAANRVVDANHDSEEQQHGDTGLDLSLKL